MKYSLIKLFLFAIALLACPIHIQATPVDDAITAYKAKKYVTAKKIFKAHAKLGDATAQRYFAEMYDKGLGMPLDYKKAIAWYKKAALQNNSAAQYRLGIKYANGQGVPTDNVNAYAWFALAFDNGYQQAAAALKVMNKTMSTEQRQKALNIAFKKLKDLTSAHP